MSGKPQLRQAAETIGGSVVGFLAKPFTISALKEALAKALLQRPK
jgi:hypothetical protein